MNVRVDVLGTLLWLAVMLGVGALLWVPPPFESDDRRPLQTFVVRPDAPVDFVLPPSTHLIKLVTIAEAPRGPQVDATLDQAYSVDVSWLDAEGAPIKVDHLDLDSSVTVSNDPDDGGEVALPVLAPRTTRLAVPDEGGDVRTVRVTVPKDGAVRVRMYRAEPPPLGRPELALLKTNERDAASLAHQIGLASWDEVTLDEALALAEVRWRGLNAVRGTVSKANTTVTLLPNAPLPESIRRATGVAIEPGRAVAWTLKGPIDVTLVGEGDLGGLALDAITEDLGRVDVRSEVATAPAWRLGARALRVRTDFAGETTLHVRNDGLEPVLGALALLDTAARPAVPAGVEAFPVASFLRDQADPNLLSVAPPRAEYHFGRVRPERPIRFALSSAPSAGVVRVALRALSPTAPAAAALHVDLVVTYADHEAVFPVHADATWSAYERVRPDPGSLDVTVGEVRVAEPIERYLPVGAGAIAVEIRTTTAWPDSVDPKAVGVLVSAALIGPTRGAVPASDLLGRTTVRYVREGFSRWTPLDASVEGTPGLPEPTWLLRANPRRELTGESWGSDDDEGADLTRHYTFLDPIRSAAGLAGESWLFPRVPGAPNDGLVWCGYDAGTDGASLPWSPAATMRLDGTLSAVVWAPGAASRPTLGDTWSLEVDGAAWATQRFQSGVAGFTGRHDPASRVSFVAPAGARAWLRGFLRGADCPDSRWQRRLVMLQPGASMTWRVHRDGSPQRVLIGGAASNPAQLWVSLTSPAPDHLLDAWTTRDRVVSLPQLDATAIALESPWMRDTALDSTSITLHDDLASEVDVTVSNVGGDPVRVFLGVELLDARERSRAPLRMPQ